MKLAREIAEAVYREQKEVRDRFGIELIEPVVAGIIAAKLEPVRAALEHQLQYSAPPDCNCSYCVEGRAVLAHLSEE